ncbi:MAG: DUF1287 domain-containing protein [Hyphomicrobiaceae bacterium]
MLLGALVVRAGSAVLALLLAAGQRIGTTARYVASVALGGLRSISAALAALNRKLDPERLFAKLAPAERRMALLHALPAVVLAGALAALQLAGPISQVSIAARPVNDVTDVMPTWVEPSSSWPVAPVSGVAALDTPRTLLASVAMGLPVQSVSAATQVWAAPASHDRAALVAAGREALTPAVRDVVLLASAVDARPVTPHSGALATVAMAQPTIETSLRVASPAAAATIVEPGPMAPRHGDADVVVAAYELGEDDPRCRIASASLPSRIEMATSKADGASAPPPLAFGARIAAAARSQLNGFVIYNEAYRRISYPMGDVAPLYGVCTDVVIRALRDLGIDLQVAVQASGVGSGDRNIDHRRTETLRRLFQRAGASRPISSYGEDYQPGDIVTYARPQNSGSRSHIAVVADAFGVSGRPMIIHNRGWGPRLEDALFVDEITGHYRLTGRERFAVTREAAVRPAAPAGQPAAVAGRRTRATLIEPAATRPVLKGATATAREWPQRRRTALR